MKRFIVFLIVAMVAEATVNAQLADGFSYQAILRDVAGNVMPSHAANLDVILHQGNANGAVIFMENHSILTNAFGLFHVEIGSVNTAEFKSIDWSKGPYFAEIKVDGVSMGTFQLLSVPYSFYALKAGIAPEQDSLNELQSLSINGRMLSISKGNSVILPGSSAWTDGVDNVTTSSKVGIGTSSPGGMLSVRGTTGLPSDSALFEVKNKNGLTVFAVYDNGAVLYVTDDSPKGGRGGFAIGSRTPGKGEIEDVMLVTPDSIRFFIEDLAAAKGGKGGFAVRGRKPTKGTVYEYFFVSPDSARFYIQEDAGKGGFAIGGKTAAKGGFASNFFDVTPNTTGIVYPSQNKVLWYPIKNAFLAGRVLIQSKDSVGSNSFATGYEAKAKGNYSQAMGYKVAARGQYSTAIGYQAQANGNSSFAFGSNSLAAGSSSLAFGDNAKALSMQSLALGYSTIVNNQYATGMGYSSQATGIGSTATGYMTKASGNYSFAGGYKSIASNNSSVALGDSVVASGGASAAFGYRTKANGINSFAGGSIATASGNYSLALGYNVLASGLASACTGYNTVSSGLYSFAGGYGSVASGNYALGLGYKAMAYGYAATATGYSTRAEAPYSFAGGINSVTDTADNTYINYPNGKEGNGATAIGYQTVAKGNGALALGYGCKALAPYSSAVGGYYCTANEWGSTAMGDNCDAYGKHSVAMGYKSETHSGGSLALGNAAITYGEYSYAIGDHAYTYGKESVSIGNGTIANGYATIALGFSNDTVKCDKLNWVSTEPLLYIGNGSGGTKRNAMIILKNGNIGIGANNPGSYRLYVAGNAYATGTWQSSDIRWKTSILQLSRVLDRILNLHGVSFKWRRDEYPEMNFDTETHIGLIAQEVEKVFPELVRSDENGFKAVAYDKLSVLLLEGIKEQQALINAQQQKLETEIRKNAQLEFELQKISERLASVEKRLSVEK